jgi:hypothetical protein
VNLRTRNFLVLWISLSLLAPAAFPAPGDGDLRIAEFIKESLSAPAPPQPQRKGDGMGRTLDVLLAGRPLPIACVSPLLLELRRHRESLPFPLRESLRALSFRPSLSQEAIHQSRDGRFVIHYTVDALSPDAIEGGDADLNGTPDGVDRVETALARAAEILSSRMGWPLPVPGSRASQYDVYLVNLGAGRGGFTALDREIPGTPADDASSHILIDAKSDPTRLESAVVHQFAHASLLALSTRAPAWWSEATASWLESRVTGDPSLLRDAMARRLERLDRSLTGDSLLLARGNSLWVSFLAERRAGDVPAVRQIWQEQSVRGADPLSALLDEILRRNGGDGLSGAFREFTRWALFTGPRDDGEHFRLGSLFPPLVPRATHEVFPAESAGAETVEPLGAAVYRFVGDGSRGGLQVRFEAEAPVRLEADLVITPSGGGRQPYLVEMEPDASGRAQAGIPWRGVAEAMMIVRNPSTSGGPGRFHFTAEIDPLFPYDLSSFSALPAAGGITLQWSTSSETDMLGWNVYRSAAPGGPFLRINPVTLPSGGDSREETDYIYQDASAPPGHRYYYAVEGITVRGLPERSFPVSAEAAAADSFP